MIRFRNRWNDPRSRYGPHQHPILQRPSSREYPAVVANINLQPVGSLVAAIVSFHEQTIGAHSYINQARTPAELVKRYQILDRVLSDFCGFTVLPFDAPAAAELVSLHAMKLQIGSMDLRLAAIALSRNLTVVTRNTRDFGRVPNLKIEDWTK